VVQVELLLVPVLVVVFALLVYFYGVDSRLMSDRRSLTSR
jgi:hypothetical protein